MLADVHSIVDVYEHGSYAKGTRITPYGDIDIVIELRSPFCSWNVRAVTPHSSTAVRPTREWIQFREFVLGRLSNQLGSANVRPATRVIKFSAPPESGLVKADLLVCQKLIDPGPMGNRSDGVIFWCRSDLRPIASFPRSWTAKVREKDQRTKGMFLALERDLKCAFAEINGRRVDEPELLRDVSSANIEIMLYSVPESLYASMRLAKVKKEVRKYLTTVAMSEERRSRFGSFDLINNSTYHEWRAFVNLNLRSIVSNRSLWS